MISEATSSRDYSLNRELALRRPLLDLIERKDIAELLADFDYDWLKHSANPNSELYRYFDSQQWIDEQGRLTRLGKLLYGRIVIHFDSLSDPRNRFIGNYEIIKRIGVGKNSAIFLATHKSLGFQVVLKFIRPGASDDIEQSLKKVTASISGSTVIMPTDILHVSIEDALDKPVPITCLVFPYVRGQQLNEFLREEGNHLNSHVVIAFIKQIGSALEALEDADAYHGDLHGDNILVVKGLSGQLEFKLIDLSYDSIGSLALADAQNNDLENFKQHIWRILSAQKASATNVSLRKFVGTKYFLKITSIISDDITSFKQTMRVFRDDSFYTRFTESQARFMSEKFEAPNSFRLQRYEEFTEPSVAAKLFVPFPELQEKINEFGNVYISGNRGSGKSTYLASLAFFPSVDDPERQFAHTFGIYFPCRQGEFRAIVQSSSPEKHDSSHRLLHVLVLKIIRRTLESLAEGIAYKKLAQAPDYSGLKMFLDKVVPSPGVILIERDILGEMDNFVSTVVRLELDELKGFSQELQRTTTLLRAIDLIRFFELVRTTFLELRNSRFHVLFDDAGEPYVQREVQQAINELIINSNPSYCVKLSAEKNTYAFRTNSGKILENGHDYYEQDISYSLFIGSGTSGVKREELEEYFRKIVALRLSYFNYHSDDIRHYVDDRPNSDERLAMLLSLGRRDAYYCGWTTIWNIADRNPRNLLELVSEIFAVGGVARDSEPKPVSARDQSRAIKTISDKRLQSLSQIAGSFLQNGVRVSLGRKLFEVTVTIGSTFHTYLKQDAVRRKKYARVRQHLAIERNELDELEPTAEAILEKLETFGVLDSSKSAYSRDDRVKKPIYVLNRIYCPAFSIGYRRDDHLRLSKKKLEQLLLDPQLFLRDGTKRLRTAVRTQIELFGYPYDELTDE